MAKLLRISMRGDDGDDEDEEAQREREEREARGRRLHNRSIFDPPPSRFEIFREKVYKYIGILRVFWKRVCNDPYQWSLFKSVLWFTIGLKLFNDLAHFAKTSAVFGGCPPPAPPKKIPPPPSCHRKRPSPGPRTGPCLQSSKVRQDPVPVPKVEPPKDAPCPPPEKSGCEDNFKYCG